jgi:hypothetical protein
LLPIFSLFPPLSTSFPFLFSYYFLSSFYPSYVLYFFLSFLIYLILS